MATAVSIYMSLFLAVGGASAGIVVLAPWEGAVLGSERVYLIGKRDRGGEGVVDVTLNGRRLPRVPLRKGVFSTALNLRPGTNQLTLRSGSSEKRFTVEYRPRGGKGLYQYHAGLRDGNCRECHPPGAGWKLRVQNRGLCHSCHSRKDGARYLHGPVGAGQCTFCHDPHGSSRPAFLTAAGRELCVRCHDQPGSRAHLERSTNRNCRGCHDSHGSDKKFFLH